MEEITATQARARLAELLRRAAAGEAFVITRWGAPVAVLGPVKRRAEGLAEFRARHGRTRGSALEELAAARDEYRY